VNIGLVLDKIRDILLTQNSGITASQENTTLVMIWMDTQTTSSRNFL